MKQPRSNAPGITRITYRSDQDDGSQRVVTAIFPYRLFEHECVAAVALIHYDLAKVRMRACSGTLLLAGRM